MCLPSSFVSAEAPLPKLTRCLFLDIKSSAKKQVKLVSAKVGWIKTEFLPSKPGSDYQIELTGVSGRVYSGSCNMWGSSQWVPTPPVWVKEPKPTDEQERLTQLPVFPPSKSSEKAPVRKDPVGVSRDADGSSLFDATIPCEEDCVGYRITNVRTGELVGEEWFKSVRKPAITLGTDGPSKWHVKTGGLPATISVHYSFDEGKSWVPGEVVLSQSEILLESSQMRWHQNKQQTHDRSQRVNADTPVIAEIQVMVGLRLYRQRYKFNEKASILPIEGVAEIKYEK